MAKGKGILAPTTKLKPLSQMLETKMELKGIMHATSTALDLYDYQYRGPDSVFSKYTDSETASEDVKLLLKTLVEYVKRYKDLLKEEGLKFLDKLRKLLNYSVHKSSKT